MKIASDISTEFLDQAEQELFEIIFQQRSTFRTRWRSHRVSRQGIPILRATGIILSMLGAVLCLYLFLKTPDGCPVRFRELPFLLVFLLFLILFYFLPQLDKHLQVKLEKWMLGNCRKQAANCVKAARNYVPYIAEYEIKDKQISYYRTKEDKTNKVWSRKLNGVAIHRKLATIIYKKQTSFLPRIIILHKDFESLAEALKEQGVAIFNHPIGDIT